MPTISLLNLARLTHLLRDHPGKGDGVVITLFQYTVPSIHGTYVFNQIRCQGKFSDSPVRRITPRTLPPVSDFPLPQRVGEIQ